MYQRPFSRLLLALILAALTPFICTATSEANPLIFTLMGQAGSSQVPLTQSPASQPNETTDEAPERTTVEDLGSQLPQEGNFAPDSPQRPAAPVVPPATSSPSSPATTTNNDDLFSSPLGLDTFSFVGIAKIFGAFLIVIALLVLFLKLLKRLSRGKTFSGGKEFVLKATMAMDTRRYLAAVEIDSRLIILAVAGDRITSLAHWPVGTAGAPDDDEFSVKELGLERGPLESSPLEEENPRNFDYDLTTPKQRRKKSKLKEPAFYSGLTEEEEAAKELAEKDFNLGFVDLESQDNADLSSALSTSSKGVVNGKINPEDLSLPDIAPNLQKKDKQEDK
jgi:flagellar biogenesis protein FliO